MDRCGVSKLHTCSPEETFELGYRLGRRVQAPSVFCFFGDLAAGKTTLIKGLAAGVTGISQNEALEQVNSPTYILLNIYEGLRPLYHFDLYRLKSSEEFIGMGFDEYLQKEGVCCIEWSERIADLMPHVPQGVIQIRMKQISREEREIDIEGIDPF
jgi:tRNA threonylcarbamoyladenosine biosynthesis protein TsaE